MEGNVTEANLNCHGSFTLDPDHCEEAGILPMEFVEIWNKNSGARISTYVILGERGSRCCILTVLPHAHVSPVTKSLSATPSIWTKAGLRR
jgi:aspartate 1-decarboxylase